MEHVAQLHHRRPDWKDQRDTGSADVNVDLLYSPHADIRESYVLVDASGERRDQAWCAAVRSIPSVEVH